MSNFSYINEEKGPYPFCPGCSHGKILDTINAALMRFKPSPSDVVIVTDIGCVGLSDQWFRTNAFHGLHGRSVLYGEGLKLAAPNQQVIVLMGDGGAGVGLHHLISAARRNINITVVVFNNFNYGMTGGEHSVTSPFGSLTSTTRTGNIEAPARLAETLSINHAPFTARRSFYDEDLTDIIEKAIMFNGFSFVEILELCTAYYAPLNRFQKKEMEHLLESQTLPRLLQIHEGRPVFSEVYAERCDLGKISEKPVKQIEVIAGNTLSNNLNITIAGSAGQKIQSTASLLAIAAIMSGLFATQKDDYPVTIKSGHSLSFLRFSEKQTEYLGDGVPDILFILSMDGHSKAVPALKKMVSGSSVYLLADLPDIETPAKVIQVDVNKADLRVAKTDIPLAVVSAWLKKNSMFDISVLKKGISNTYDEKAASKMKNIVDSVDMSIFNA